MVKEINQGEFAEAIKNNKVLVDCYAPWCGPCKMISPIIDSISDEISNINFYKLNIDNAGDIAEEYGIMSIPTLLIFENGKLANKVIGFQSKEQLEELLK